jgi:HlyD family secretion protein
VTAVILSLLARMGRREAGVAMAGVTAVLLGGATVGLRQTAPNWPDAVAERRPFSEQLVEPGTIAAQRIMLYGSSITGAQAKIVELAAEGRAVHAGDVLIRFDTAQFEQTLAAERAALRQAEAELTRAIEEARVEALRAQGDLEAANQQVANAERGLANELGGKGHVAVVEAETTLADAERELERARTVVADLEPLLAEKFITRAELERAEQALRRAADQAALARAKRDSQVQYEQQSAASRAEADLNLARIGLARHGETASARLAQRRAAIAAARSRVDEISARVDFHSNQIERATVRAEGPGMVVYRDLFFGSSPRKPQIGDEVFPNQPVIALPDASQLVVETRIRENDLHKLSAAQRVQVRVNAYPDVRLDGSIALIGALALEDSGRAGTKFFPVSVQLSSADPRLRTGMTARVDIEVASIANAITVPVHAVFREAGSAYVVIVRGSRPLRRPVTVLAENETHSALAAGVEPGERVLLVDATTDPDSP